MRLDLGHPHPHAGYSPQMTPSDADAGRRRRLLRRTPSRVNRRWSRASSPRSRMIGDRLIWGSGRGRAADPQRPAGNLAALEESRDHSRADERRRDRGRRPPVDRVGKGRRGPRLVAAYGPRRDARRTDRGRGHHPGGRPVSSRVPRARREDARVRRDPSAFRVQVAARAHLCRPLEAHDKLRWFRRWSATTSPTSCATRPGDSRPSCASMSATETSTTTASTRGRGGPLRLRRTRSSGFTVLGT